MPGKHDSHLSLMLQLRPFSAQILNGIEPIGWLAAAILPIIGMVRGCSVTGCILSGVLVGLSVALLWVASRLGSSSSA